MADKLDIEAERLVAELRRTYTEWNNPPSPSLPHNANAVLLAADTLTALIAEVRRLKAALKPFADLADRYDVGSVNWVPDACPVRAMPENTRESNVSPTVGDLRAVRVALKDGGAG